MQTHKLAKNARKQASEIDHHLFEASTNATLSPYQPGVKRQRI
jgi:hypothetical protein